MPRCKVELLGPAWVDLDVISDYHLLEVGVESARKITDKILSSLERLETFPLSCPLIPYKELAEQGYRLLVCGKYVCIYKVQGNMVYVHHIVAAATDYPALFR
ncbi:MAG: type II toxin-antitoxin system RelE/ParE family toxin [Defluviitaleaceae bacterium]|nr:type II toxin-antitoxin system RelE/ParE family toxin [Defluviitaleaceae bacterium]